MRRPLQFQIGFAKGEEITYVLAVVANMTTTTTI